MSHSDPAVTILVFSDIYLSQLFSIQTLKEVGFRLIECVNYSSLHPTKKDEKERATIKNVFSRSTLFYALE